MYFSFHFLIGKSKSYYMLAEIFDMGAIQYLVFQLVLCFMVACKHN